MAVIQCGFQRGVSCLFYWTFCTQMIAGTNITTSFSCSSQSLSAYSRKESWSPIWSKTSEKNSPLTPPIVIKAGDHYRFLCLKKNDSKSQTQHVKPGKGPAKTLFSLPTQHFSRSLIEPLLTFCIISCYGNVKVKTKVKKNCQIL